MKKILILYYSQSGQQLNILQTLARPFISAGHKVHFEEIQPQEKFPFPWSAFDFFNAFPETFGQKPLALKSPSAQASDAYDLVILGHIIHSEGEKHGKELLRKSYAALRPGGKLLIGEYVPNDARTGPAMPLLFGLNMLLQTEVGAVFTLREYRDWLKGEGFHKVVTVPVPPPSTVIIATK